MVVFKTSRNRPSVRETVVVDIVVVVAVLWCRIDSLFSQRAQPAFNRRPVCPLSIRSRAPRSWRRVALLNNAAPVYINTQAKPNEVSHVRPGRLLLRFSCPAPVTTLLLCALDWFVLCVLSPTGSTHHTTLQPIANVRRHWKQ